MAHAGKLAWDTFGVRRLGSCVAKSTRGARRTKLLRHHRRHAKQGGRVCGHRGGSQKRRDGHREWLSSSGTQSASGPPKRATIELASPGFPWFPLGCTVWSALASHGLPMLCRGLPTRCRWFSYGPRWIAYGRRWFACGSPWFPSVLRVSRGFPLVSPGFPRNPKKTKGNQTKPCETKGNHGKPMTTKGNRKQTARKP